MKKHLLLASSVVLVGLLAAAGLRTPSGVPSPAPPEPVVLPAPPPVSVKKAELAVSFDLQLRARTPDAARGSPLEATTHFTLTDPHGGQPLRGVRPLGWMNLRPEGQAAPDETACKERIQTFLGGLLSARPDVNLNSYLFLTLNHDHTLSVIDPQIALSRTKLQNLVSLGGAPADWALTPDMKAVYVSIPVQGTVSVVDTRRFVVVRNVAVGREPGRLAVSPDGRSVWVSNEGDGTVSIIDTGSRQVLDTLEVGEGKHEFAFGEEGRTAWISSSEEGVLVAVDVASREVLGRVRVGQGLGSIAYSEVARALYAVQERTGEVWVVDAASREVSRRISLATAPGELRFEPSGRWAFVLYPRGNRVDVLDAASSQVAHSLTGFSEPDRVLFTQAFAYVRNTGDARMSLIELASLEKSGKPSVVQVTMGQKRPSLAKDLGRSAPVAVLPEGNTVLVAGTPDRALYLYSEGMMAPRGTHLNYGREPKAVLVLDRSLREVEPGVFTSEAVVRENGTYDVFLLLDNPRTSACLEWKVAGVPEDASAFRKLPFTLKPEFNPSQLLTAGVPARLRFQLAPAAHLEDQRPLSPEELQVLVFRPPSGHWQQRPEPRRAGDGLFEIEFTPPDPGQYQLLVGVEGRGAALGELPHFTLGVQPALTASTTLETHP
ncbi:YncE family protein [Archangium violaceum]|uniref:YncE family protein n=1 Tax=Archangium violaceum TaxID=83451 RepID=UPI0036D8E2DD